jgi:ABC-type nickel/cobalt efflux system permease component RcnA
VIRVAAYLFWTVLWSALAAGSVSAHPLGNFTINHLAKIEARGDRLRVHYVLDIAEIPSFQIMHAAGPWNAARVRDWNNAEAQLVAGSLSVQANAVALQLHLIGTSSRTRPGAGGLPILYWTGDYTVALPSKAAVEVRDLVYADRRIGWKDIVLPATSDPTNELRAYPSALIGSPRRNDEASFDVTAGHIANVRVRADASVMWGASSLMRSSVLSDLVARSGQTPFLVLLTLLAAFGLGALHGLEPGHGKALLAFTLVGARATFKQAAVLAAALTFAHTIAVVLLGVLLFAAAGFAAESLFTWITLISGLAVVAIGARALSAAVARAAHEREHARSHAHGAPHEHSHDHPGGHSHAIPGAAPLHFRSAVVAAMSGGIAPCPAAIVVLLTALHLHRVGYGLLLIVIFSLGLAAILTGLGMAVVHGAAWLGRQSAFARVARVAPFITAGVISIIGSGMVAQGMAEVGVPLSEPALAAFALLGIASFAFFPAFLSPRSLHRTLAIKETT